MAYDTTLSTNSCFVITPSTNAATKFYAVAFMVLGTSGQSKNIRVITGTSQDVTFTGVPAGTRIPQIITAVRTTSTTATSIIGFGPN